MSDITVDPETIFDFLDPLGTGSFGNVYKAIDKRTGILVAVKIIDLDQTDRNAVTEEVAIMQRCRHTNIVSLRDSFVKNDMLWIAIEYCGGGSVLDLMEALDRPLTEIQCAVVLREALSGLAYLHKQLLIHRDIKCANIFVDHSGRCKVGDFGISAQLFNSQSKRKTLIGSPFWMAPEIVMGAEYNKKVDTWALGISAIEMATMQLPYGDLKTLAAIMRAIRSPPAPELPREEGKPRFSDIFHDFVQACLTFDPDSRPTCQDLLQHPFIQSAGSIRLVSSLVYEALPILVEKRRLDREKEQKVPDDESLFEERLTSSQKPSDTVVINSWPGTMIVGGTMIVHNSLSKSKSKSSSGSLQRSGPQEDLGATVVVHPNGSLTEAI